MSISYADIPASINRAGVKTIYYRRRTGNKDKYVYLHPEDRDYIIHWCNRLVCDVAAKQVVEPGLYEDFYKTREYLPKSGYSKFRNSVMTYCSGIVSNALRNPGEDIAYKQIKYIETIMKIIQFAYTQGQLCNEVGYHHSTGIPNDPPLKIKFKDA